MLLDMLMLRLDDFIDEEIDATLDECKYDASQGRRSKATTIVKSLLNFINENGEKIV